MKHYQSILKAAATVGTFAATMKAISKIKAETEDEDLQHLIDSAVAHLQDSDSRHRGVVPSALEKHTDPRARRLVEYCRKKVKDAIPEWKILATKHGWTPPID